MLFNYEKNDSININDYDWMINIIEFFEIDPTKIDRSFFGGTMFIIDYKFIIDCFSNIDIDKLYNATIMGYTRDYSIEHALERIFCFLVQKYNHNILTI